MIDSHFHPLLIGHGKLTRHLQHYFTLKNIKHEIWNDARNLKHPALETKLAQTNAIWILVSDQAILEVKNQLEEILKKNEGHSTSKTWLHSSAAHSFDQMITIHPLMTFGPDLYPCEKYEVMPLTLFTEEISATSEVFRSWINAFPNSKHILPLQQKEFYHAVCVMVSNLPQILWSNTTRLANQQLKLPPFIFSEMIKQSLENFLLLGQSALTGPLVRGDHSTLKKNARALFDLPHGEGEAFAQLYQAFSTFYGKTNSQEAPHDHGTGILDL